MKTKTKVIKPYVVTIRLTKKQIGEIDFLVNKYSSWNKKQYTRAGIIRNAVDQLVDRIRLGK